MQTKLLIRRYYDLKNSRVAHPSVAMAMAMKYILEKIEFQPLVHLRIKQDDHDSQILSYVQPVIMADPYPEIRYLMIKDYYIMLGELTNLPPNVRALAAGYILNRAHILRAYRCYKAVPHKSKASGRLDIFIFAVLLTRDKKNVKACVATVKQYIMYLQRYDYAMSNELIIVAFGLALQFDSFQHHFIQRLLRKKDMLLAFGFSNRKTMYVLSSILTMADITHKNFINIMLNYNDLQARQPFLVYKPITLLNSFQNTVHAVYSSKRNRLTPQQYEKVTTYIYVYQVLLAYTMH